MISKSILKKPSNYLFAGLVALSFSIFLVAFIKLLKFGIGTSDANLTNVLQMIFSVVSILVLSIYISIIKVAKLNVTCLFDFFLMPVLFLVFGIYPCYNLFASKISLAILFAVVGFILSVISISVFFHFEKEQNGTVNANTLYLLFFIILFEFACTIVFEILLYFVLKSSGVIIFKTAADCFVCFTYSLIGLFVCILLSVISLYRDKKFLNLCLVSRISD